MPVKHSKYPVQFSKKHPSPRQIENEALKEVIKTIFYEHRRRYGSVRMIGEGQK